MVTYVLDASAVLRYIDDEAGADRVAEIFLLKSAGSALVVISAIQWGEIIGVILKRHGLAAAKIVLARLNSLSLDVIPVTAERAARVAEIKFNYKIPYADSFGVELAGDSPDHSLITADFDVEPARSAFSIEFLPSKSKQ